MSLKTEPYAGDMWDRFIDFIDKREGIKHKNLLGDIEAYRRLFIVANMKESESSSLILEREEAGGETSDSSHLAVPTNGPESIGDAERTAAITAYLVLARKSGAWEPGSLPSDWEPDLLVFSPTQLYAFSRLLEAELRKQPSGLA